MGSKSKNKGSNAERAVAKLLTGWTGEEWLRVPNSGALRWGGAAWVYGDLLPPEQWNVIVESKHYKTIDLELMATKPAPGNVLGWWDQVCSDVRRCKGERDSVCQPLLVFKSNRRPPRLVIERSLFLALGPPAVDHMALRKPKYDLIILDMPQFLDRVEPSAFLEACKSHSPNCLG